MTTSNGQFIWHELHTTDIDAAKSFYMRIAPWKTQQFQDSAYTMWTNDGAPIGAVMSLDAELKSRGVPPHWLPYVGVYDVDACVRQTPSLGGQVRMGPTEVPNIGAWAVIADPQGAVLGLYEPEGEGPRSIASGGRGEFSWHELMTTDMIAGFDFYHALFKWEKTGTSDMGPLGTYQMFGLSGRPFGGMFNKSPEMPAPSWWTYVHVDDAAQSAAAVTSAGGRVMNGPMTVAGGDMIAVCADPQGVQFALHAPKKGAP